MHEPPRPTYRHGPFFSRGYLPHDDRANTGQLVTFRISPATAPHERSLLASAAAAEAIASELLEAHPQLVRLATWVVMPDHVHVVLRTTEAPLSLVVARWKRRSAKRVNAAMRRSGPLWNRDYFDRRLVDDEAMLAAIAYVEANPVRARFCRAPLDWPWSGLRWRLAGRRAE